MKARSIINYMLLGVVMISSCYYDSEEKLYPGNNCITTNMSFQDNIVPILQYNCYSCHSAAVNSGNVTLEGYSNIMIHVNNGKLLGAIHHASGFKPMPQNAPKLGACDIAKIDQWVADGTPNN